MHWKFEFLLEPIGEFAGFFSGTAIGAAETERETDDDFADLIGFENGLEGSEIGALVLAEQCGETLRGDAERVGDSETDAAGAVVEGENAAMYRSRVFYRGHAQIIVAHTKARVNARYGERAS